MNSRKVDLYLIVLFLLIVVYSGYQVFYHKYSLPFSGGERISLGKLSFLSNDVRKRSFDQLAWEEAADRDVLYNNDRIFTDANSEAMIKFDSGNELKIGEETLFQLSLEGDSVNLDLEQGIVFANLNSTAQSFVVVVNNQIFEIKSNKARLKIDKKKGYVSVVDGSASFKVGNKNISVSSGKSVALDASLSIKDSIEELVKLPDEAPKLISPSHREEFFFYSPDTLKVEWDEEKELQSGLEYILEINGKPFKTKKNYSYLNINRDQNISWRVGISNGEDEIWSQKRDFKIILDNEDAPLQEGRRVVLKRPGDVVSFDWQDSDTGKSYLLEVSKDRKFKEVFKKVETRSNSTSFKFNTLGEFFWRTKIIDDSGRVKFARPVKIKVVPPPPPEPPKLKKRYLKKVSSLLLYILELFIPSANAAEDIIKLDWEPVENVKKYKIEIYQEDKMIHSSDTEESFFDWKFPAIGKYKWRIASVDYWDQVGEFSEFSEVEIQKEKKKEKRVRFIKLISPYHGRQYFSDEKITLKWEKIKGRKYLVEISKDSSFTKVKNIRLSIEELKLRNVKFNTFYWRIRSGPLVSKKRRIEVLKRIVEKKSWRKPKSEFGLELRPQLVTYENIVNQNSIDIDGIDILSFNIYMTKYYQDSKIAADFQKSSGTVFDDLDFSRNILNLEYRRDWSFHTWGIGTSIWNGTSYLVENDSVVEKKKTHVSGLGSFVIDLDYLKFFSRVSLGGVNSVELSLRKPVRVFKHDIDLSFGGKISKFSDSEESQIIFVGVGKSFKKY